MKIKFHDTLYNLIANPNVMSTHFQATFEKSDNTFDAIATDTLNTDEITVYDGEEVKAIYSGFTKRIALYVLDGNEHVSVEFENTNIQSQIDSLTATLSAVQEAQATTDSAIAELGDTVNSVAETNDTQDEAINDLATAVDELSGTEG